MTSKLVLQINSLDALERLIGGDAEVEVEIRNNIAAKFAEKHLKQLANSSEVMGALTKAQCELREMVQTQVTTALVKVKNSAYYGMKIGDLHSEIKTLIEEAVKTSVDAVVTNAVRADVAKLATQEILERKITREVTSQVNERVTTEVKKRIDAMLAGLPK